MCCKQCRAHSRLCKKAKPLPGEARRCPPQPQTASGAGAVVRLLWWWALPPARMARNSPAKNSSAQAKLPSRGMHSPVLPSPHFTSLASRTWCLLSITVWMRHTAAPQLLAHCSTAAACTLQHRSCLHTAAPLLLAHCSTAAACTLQHRCCLHTAAPQLLGHCSTAAAWTLQHRSCLDSVAGRHARRAVRTSLLPAVWPGGVR